MARKQITDNETAQQWLSVYGYDTLEQFQDVSDIPITGEVCQATSTLMSRPRCGVQDFAMTGDCKWRDKTHLTYWTGPGFNLFKAEEGKPGRLLSAAVIDNGFKAWAAVTQFTFERIKDGRQADIWIGGGRGRQYDFDGPGNTLAWAYMPCGSFDFLESRFDVDERWTHNKGMSDPWVYAPSVWLHELGHCLGLGHSHDPKDLMAPYYNPDIATLQPGDIRRIQSLYG